MIKPYYQDKSVTHYCSDALSVLSELESESVDLLATDPPYGISFMGKYWDKALPDKKIWEECLRVLKPGAFAFVMSIPRSDCLSRMIISLEDAGFRVDFTPIYWAYASGFPKAQNIGKAVDKRRIGDKFKEIRDYLRQCYKESGKTQKQLAYAMSDFTIGGGRVSHYFGNEQPLVPNWIDWCILKGELNMDDRYDYHIREFERDVLGTARERKTSQWCRTSDDNNTYITEPQTKEAKALDGSYGGFQPKPAVEVIIVAMKPLSEKTFVDQALKNQKGITWLDDCRIPYESEEDKEKARFGTQMDIRGGNLKTPQGIHGKNILSSQSGRFPANLLVSDDVLNDGKVTKTSNNPNRFKGLRILPESKGWNQNDIICNSEAVSGDSGSFSRYFDLDKFFDGLLDKLKSKAYNKDKNTGDILWGVNQAEEENGLKNNPLPANGAISNSPITPAIELNNITSALNPATPTLDLANQNLNVKSAEKKLDCTETTIAQRIALIKQDTETLLEILENESIIPTTQNKPSLLNQSVANYVVCKMKDLRDIIQTSIDQPKLFGSVVPAIIKQMQQDLSQDQLWQNFWREQSSLLTKSQQQTYPFAIISKASKSEKNKGLENIEPIQTNDGRNKLPDNAFQHDKTYRTNSHPTVKPLKLMSYLVTLGSRPGDTVLDPFLGSGTTALACKLLSRKCIGIELEEKYCEIATKRCSQNVFDFGI